LKAGEGCDGSGSANCGVGAGDSGSAKTGAGGSGSEYEGAGGSGAENWGTGGLGSGDRLNGDGIGGVVGKSPGPPEGSFPELANGEGGGSPKDGGAGLGSLNDGRSEGVGSASGGISITSASSRRFDWAIRVLSSDAGVDDGIGSDGIWRGSSSEDGPDSEGGGGVGASSLDDRNADAMSSALATIVLYGSAGAASCTRGVPSVWQKRIASSKVFWQVGHRFISFILGYVKRLEWGLFAENTLNVYTFMAKLIQAYWRNSLSR
jgi:hypothetical protein